MNVSGTSYNSKPSKNSKISKTSQIVESGILRVLIVKTSSMGDVIHSLPAVTDLAIYYANRNINLQIDWVVEEGFVEIPRLHKAVTKVIPIALRRWRKQLLTKKCKKTMLEIKSFYKNLTEQKYDYIIDAQGLLKSAIICKLAKLVNDRDKSNIKKYRHGLDARSSRGQYISWAYNKQYAIEKDLHAIYRVKKLFSKIFGYSYQENILDYGLDYSKLNTANNTDLLDYMDSSKDSSTAHINNTDNKPYLVFLHCTTWNSKKWPQESWRELISLAISNGYNIKLNSGNQAELQDAINLASGYNSSQVTAMPPKSIEELVQIIAYSSGVVCVDTGLGHLAAALNKPGVGIFGATSPKLTSILSNKFTNLSSSYECSPCFLRECVKLTKQNSNSPPCYKQLTAEKVWQSLNLIP